MFGTLIASLATGEILSSIQRLKKALTAYLIAGLLLLIGVVFLLVSGTIWLARRLGPVEATLALGVIFVVIAGLILLIHSISSRSVTRVAKSRRGRDFQKAAIATGIALLPTLLSGRAGKAMLLAPAIGALAYALYRENRPRRESRADLEDD